MNKSPQLPQFQSQPETIMVECSAQNSAQSTDNNDEWEVAIPPIRLEQGDAISVNQSFLEARGTSTEVLEFSSSGLNQNNKQTLYYEYYGCDDGTNDKNKGKDWYNYGLNHATPETTIQTSKSYNPCKAFRYDRLWDESTINANGYAFKRDIKGTTISSVVSTAIDPLISNAFNVEPREDYMVGGVFNSIDAIKEMNGGAKYIGDTQTYGLNDDEKTLRITDACINLDAFDYWEIFRDADLGDKTAQYTRIRIPYEEANKNYLAQFPIGTIIQIKAMPKRRQMSVYDTSTHNYAETEYPIGQYENLSGRFTGIEGHFFISDMGEGVFADDPIGNPIPNIDVYSGGTFFGYNNVPCYELRIRNFYNATTPNLASPYIHLPSVGTAQKSYGNSTSQDGVFMNKHSTQSHANLTDGTHTINSIIPVCLMIRRSPYYIGSQINSTSFPLPDDIALLPSVKVQSGDNYRTAEDADLFELYPKQSILPSGSADPTLNTPLPICIGQFKFNNTDRVHKTSVAPATQGQNFIRLTEKTIGTMTDYWTANKTLPYNPLSHTLNSNWIPTQTDHALPYFEGNMLKDTTTFAKQHFPDNSIIVLGYNSPTEEVIITGQIWDVAQIGATNNYSYKCEVVARNITNNQNIFTGGNPRLELNANNGAMWVNTNGDCMTQPATTPIMFYDFQEGKCANFKIDPDLLRQYLPTGMPFLKNNGYLGINEPSLNPRVQYDDNIMENYKYGSQYFIYYNTSRTGYEDFLPDCSFPISATESFNETQVRGRLGVNKGVFMFSLTDAVPLTSARYKLNRSSAPYSISAEIRSSSSSTNAFTGTATDRGQGYGEINQNTLCWNMAFDFEEDKCRLDLDGRGKVFTTNLYLFTPDAIDALTPTYNTNTQEPNVNTLKRISNSGTDLLCGYVPFINQITIEAPKDYLTPTDLSNFWTEELHKLKDIINLYDGATIEGSSSRGVLQNPCLQPIYGSWGIGNFPTGNGYLARDKITFPMTNGLALGSVMFLDGHAMPNDWEGTNFVLASKTLPIYPRSPNNMINLWDTATKMKLPQYAITRMTSFNGTTYTTATRDCLATTYGLATGFTYPEATSGLSNNTNLSQNAPNTTASVISKVNLSYGAGNTSATNQAEPKYSTTPLDGYDLFTNAVEYPFSGAGQREDPIYRETQDYPLSFFKDAKYGNYLKFSQYLGTDNMTLTFNDLVSAYEYQFLHQPYATSYSLIDGSATGGDNAIRIFDNVPKEVSNWERYGGLNIRNWCSTDLPKKTFTFAEVLNPPTWTIPNYPNGLNPESVLEKVGQAFMNKLGYTNTQLQTTNIKGVAEWNADLFTYTPNGTTGADPDVADAIINTTISAEDNPNSEAHNGRGQLIFYPSSADTNQKNIRHNTTGGTTTPLGVRYDYAYTNFAQRGGLKSQNHNKSYGFPNITGSPLVKDTTTFPMTFNPDGEQRSGYTIEIGSSPVRAKNLPIKLTDGYYYILCPDLIDDPQFYITANNGSVVPAIAIISKTYVSGDFYTSFQSPITFYCKKPKTITSIKVQIRNSTMGVPSNLGGNSSVIFSIRRMNPQPPQPPLTTSQQQDLDYTALERGQVPNATSPLLKTISDLFNLDMGVLMPYGNPAQGEPTDIDDPNWTDIEEMTRGNQADINPLMRLTQQVSGYYNDLLQRINQVDLPSMNGFERDEFFKTREGARIKSEMNSVVAERRAQILAEESNDPVNILLEELERDKYRTPKLGGTATTPMRGVRAGEATAQSRAPLTTTLRNDEVEGLRTLLPTAGSSVDVEVGDEQGIQRKESKATADTGLGESIAPTTIAPTEYSVNDEE